MWLDLAICKTDADKRALRYEIISMRYPSTPGKLVTIGLTITFGESAIVESYKVEAEHWGEK